MRSLLIPLLSSSPLPSLHPSHPFILDHGWLEDGASILPLIQEGSITLQCGSPKLFIPIIFRSTPRIPEGFLVRLPITESIQAKALSILLQDLLSLPRTDPQGAPHTYLLSRVSLQEDSEDGKYLFLPFSTLLHSFTHPGLIH